MVLSNQSPGLPIVHLNGAFLPLAEARISPEDRGFLLGDGVFDTLRTYHGRFFRFDQHADRFFAGLEEVRIMVPFTRAELHALLDELIRRNGMEDAVVRITVSRGAGRGGYAFDPATPPTVYASVRAIPDVARLRRDGVAIGVSEIPRPLPFLGVVKTTSVGAMALARILSDRYEVVMPSADGLVAEGAASWIMAIIDGRCVTPRAERLLPSVTRIVVEEFLEIEERDVSFDALVKAEAMMISATSTGPIPVARIDAIDLPVHHPIFERLYAGYDERVRRECVS